MEKNKTTNSFLPLPQEAAASYEGIVSAFFEFRTAADSAKTLTTVLSGYLESHCADADGLERANAYYLTHQLIEMLAAFEAVPEGGES